MDKDRSSNGVDPVVTRYRRRSQGQHDEAVVAKSSQAQRKDKRPMIIKDAGRAREIEAALAAKVPPAKEQGSPVATGKELVVASPDADAGIPMPEESLALIVQLAEDALASNISSEGLNTQKRKRREKAFQGLCDRLKARLAHVSLPPGTLREDLDPSRLLENNVTRARCLAESKEELAQLQRTCRQRSRELEAHEEELRRLQVAKRSADRMHAQLQRRNLHPALRDMVRATEGEAAARSPSPDAAAGAPQGVTPATARGSAYNPSDDEKLMDVKRAAAVALEPIDSALSGVAARLSGLSELVETLDQLTTSLPSALPGQPG